LAKGKKKTGGFDKKKSPEKKGIRPEKKGEVVVEMRGIVKKFPGVIANNHVNFEVRAGEIHALLGENGAGKTTLMNVLYGLYQPDEGEIYVRGKKVNIKSPKDAIELGIGMVHQHFMLVPPMSVTENIILGLKSPKEPFLDLENAEKKILELSQRYGLKVDPKAKIWQLSVGEQQRVEILKALYRGAEIFILDEPTAVLTPQEVDQLFETVKKMTKEGRSIIFITHKLREVLAVSDRITVLRQGKVMGTLSIKEATREKLAEMMVGREVVFEVEKVKTKLGKEVLQVKDLHALSDKGIPALKGVSFSIREGEILGVAGVSGNGQRELSEVITGLRKATKGQVIVMGKDVTNRSPAEIIEAGVGHIPEDRLGMGLIMDFSLKENVILEMHSKPPFANGWFLNKLGIKSCWFLNAPEIDKFADKLISEFNIVAPSREVPAKNLSGGNLQKLILAREISRRPKVLIACQPTRGLDVGATEYIRKKLLEEAQKGVAILLISEDLDEVLMMSDRIAVMYEGQIMDIVPPDTDIRKIGLLMAGVKEH